MWCLAIEENPPDHVKPNKDAPTHCKVCEKTIHPGRRRNTRLYCSDACRRIQFDRIHKAIER